MVGELSRSNNTETQEMMMSKRGGDVVMWWCGPHRTYLPHYPTTNITVTVKLFGLIINWIVRRLDSSSPDIIVAID